MKRKNNVFVKAIAVLFLVLAFSIGFSSAAEAAKLNKKSITIVKGKTYTLKLKGTSKKAKWKTSKKTVAKLTKKKSKSVKIKAVKAGKAVVSAKVGKKTYKCKVTVVDPKLSRSSIQVTAGNKYTLRVLGGAGTVTWKSSNSSIAIVNSVGTVTGLKAGKVNITAKRNGKVMVCAVTVTAKSGSSEGNSENGGSTSNPSGGGYGSDEETEMTYNLHMNVYTNYRSEWECSCGIGWGHGYKTENLGDFESHIKAHSRNREPYNSRTNELKDFVQSICIEFSNKEEYDKFNTVLKGFQTEKERGIYALEFYNQQKGIE